MTTASFGTRATKASGYLLEIVGGPAAVLVDGSVDLLPLGVDRGAEHSGEAERASGDRIEGRDADQRAAEREPLGGGETDPKSRVGAGSDVAGQKFDRIGRPAQFVEKRADGRSDFTAVDHPFSKSRVPRIWPASRRALPPFIPDDSIPSTIMTSVRSIRPGRGKSRS